MLYVTGSLQEDWGRVWLGPARLCNSAVMHRACTLAGPGGGYHVTGACRLAQHGTSLCGAPPQPSGMASRRQPLCLHWFALLASLVLWSDGNNPDLTGPPTVWSRQYAPLRIVLTGMVDTSMLLVCVCVCHGSCCIGQTNQLNPQVMLVPRCQAPYVAARCVVSETYLGRMHA